MYIIFTHVCTSANVHRNAGAPGGQKTGSPGTGVTGGGALTAVGAGCQLNWGRLGVQCVLRTAEPPTLASTSILITFYFLCGSRWVQSTAYERRSEDH